MKVYVCIWMCGSHLADRTASLSPDDAMRSFSALCRKAKVGGPGAGLVSKDDLDSGMTCLCAAGDDWVYAFSVDAAGDARL